MSFLSPAFLLGLPLIAVPVIIHFFSRRQRAVIRWGAMEFLLASATTRRRFLRLRDLLLMLLRAAVVLAIICALAQPMVSSTHLGSVGPRDVILVLDNSMSTARRLGAGTVFDREVDEALRVLGQLNGADRLRVLLASPKPEWLDDRSSSADQAGLRTLAARLRDLKPNDGAADLVECVRQAIQTEPAGKEMTRLVALVTDGQAYGWRADETNAWASLQTLAQKASPPVFTSVIVAGAAAGAVANLSVDKVAATRAVAGVGQAVAFTASVRNTGTVPSEATSLAWSAGAQALGVSAVPALQPGAGTTVKLSQPFAAPGLFEISCRLTSEDELPADNSSRFLLEVTRAVPILLVEGEPRTDPIQSDTQYFLAALGSSAGAKAGSPANSVFEPKLLNYQQLRGEALSSFRGVVLANVPRLPADVIQKLMRYVNSGGGLWIALGEQTDVDAFNREFFAQGAGLSPVALRQPVGDADDREKFTALVPPVPDHPATALLADLQRLDIDRAKVYRRHQFEADNGSSVSVLLRIEGGAPLVVEKSSGRGRVIVQAVPLGLAWSNLPLCHSYVVMVYEWLWYLAEPGLVKRNLQPGELLQASDLSGLANGIASLETPGGQLAHLVGHEEEGSLIFRYPKTQLPGQYLLTIPGVSQAARSEKFLVSRDPEESNLTPLTEPQKQALAAAGGLRFGSEPLSQPASQPIAAPPRAVAQWLLLALVLLMAAEAAFAFWLARLRRSTTPAVVMQPGFRV